MNLKKYMPRSRYKNMLQGIGSLFSLRPHTPDYRDTIDLSKTVEERIEENWTAVGDSMRRAIDNFEKEHNM